MTAGEEPARLRANEDIQDYPLPYICARLNLLPLPLSPVRPTLDAGRV